MPTGYHDLDAKTSGLQPGDLLIVAGRPSMGKTSFALNMAEHVAIEVGLPVAVFSMEMGGTQLAMRMLSSVGKLDAHRVRTGRSQFRRRHRNLPGTRHANQVDGIGSHAMLKQRALRAVDQGIDNARIPATGNDRKSRTVRHPQIAFQMRH